MLKLLLVGIATMAALATACGGSSGTSTVVSSTATRAAAGGSTAPTKQSTTATSPTAATAASGFTQAQFNATDACKTLTADQMAALVGGPVSNPTAHPGPGPIQCVFSASVNGQSSPGGIQIAYFTANGGTTPKAWIDGNENGYKPQAEPGLGDYAVFDPSLRETSAARGPVAIVVSGSAPGAAVADVEAAQAAAVNAIIKSLGL